MFDFSFFLGAGIVFGIWIFKESIVAFLKRLKNRVKKQIDKV